MPVRDKVVERLCRSLVGGLSFDLGVVRDMPQAQYDLLRLSVDAAYDGVVRTVDWNRVYWDAHGRHEALHTDRAHSREPGIIEDLVVPSPAALAAAAEQEDEGEEAVKPLAVPSFWREDSVCPECLMEAMLAQDYGGKSGDRWAAEPESPPWRFPNWRRRFPGQRAAVLKLIAERWERPEPAESRYLGRDGHMKGCVETRRRDPGTDEYLIRCDPRCPHYDGRLERLTEATT